MRQRAYCMPESSRHVRRNKNLRGRDGTEIVLPVHCRTSFAKQVFGAAFSANLSGKHKALYCSGNPAVRLQQAP